MARLSSWARPRRRRTMRVSSRSILAPTPMLELTNVDAGYSGFQALFGISMSVSTGEAVAVIGANGAGKTTLLRVISGLLPATDGTMTMESVSLRTTPPHKIIDTGIAHVPEGRRLFPRLSVENNLKIGAFIPAARAKFAERLAFVYELFPRLKERRAADVRDRPRADERTQTCLVGRALDGVGAGDRRAGVRPGPAHPLRRLYGADRRAERASGAQDRGSRLPARSRPPESERQRAGACGE